MRRIPGLVEEVLVVKWFGYSLVFLVLTAFWGGRGRPMPEPKQPANALRVLFIGNSLTYSQDLPSIIEALAQAGRQRPFVHKEITAGGAALQDHWNRGVQKTFKKGEWDLIVLQQGPSASRDGRQLLLDYARLFAPEIRRVGARPAIYMVWPSADRRPIDLDRSSESHQMAAEENDAVLFPAGEAWRAAWRRDPSLVLDTDGLHPNKTGAYLTALVFYQGLYGKSPVGLPSQLRLRSGGSIKIEPGLAKMLQESAAEANEKFGRK